MDTALLCRRWRARQPSRADGELPCTRASCLCPADEFLAVSEPDVSDVRHTFVGAPVLDYLDGLEIMGGRKLFTRRWQVSDCSTAQYVLGRAGWGGGAPPCRAARGLPRQAVRAVVAASARAAADAAHPSRRTASEKRRRMPASRRLQWGIPPAKCHGDPALSPEDTFKAPFVDEVRRKALFQVGPAAAAADG